MKLNSKMMERPRYFPRQLVTPGDMTLEQEYFRQKMRRHNRFLHGWGVVCGAEVCRVPPSEKEPWKVKIKPGYILDPCGEEIYIAQPHIVDVRSLVTGTADPTGHTKDPWCSDVPANTLEGHLCLAVRYVAKEARPVPLQPVGCGTSEQCENSRWLDCYEFQMLPECPPSHQDPPQMQFGEGPNPACPSEPTDSWVVLACLDIDETGITNIDTCACRRLVMGFGHLWWQCESMQAVAESPDDLNLETAFARLRVIMRDAVVSSLRTVDDAPYELAEAIANTPGLIRKKLEGRSIADVAEEPADKLMNSLGLSEEDLRDIEELQAKAKIVVETAKRYSGG